MSVFREISKAYNEGRRAKREGKSFNSNPYTPRAYLSRSHSSFGSWSRGWLSEDAPSVLGGNDKL